MFDNDSGILYLCGKGDSTICLYECESMESSHSCLLDILLGLLYLEMNLLSLAAYQESGGEIMRSGICRWIECISLSRFTLSVNDQVRVLNVMLTE
jgi:hypothetical protein